MEAKFPQLQDLHVGFIIAFVVEMQHQHEGTRLVAFLNKCDATTQWSFQG